MARRYGEPIRVTVAATTATTGHSKVIPAAAAALSDTTAQRVTSFTWRGRRYWVRVLSTWRLRSNWWQPEPQQQADRTYYRVVTADHQVFELYHDVASSAWVLDVVQD